MNRILVPVNFSTSSANALQYAHGIATKRKMYLSLLYCYSYQEQNRKYDFGDDAYDLGIRRMLVDFYKEHIGEPTAKTKFMARMGSVVEKIIHISASYRMVVVSGNNYGSPYQRWIGSKSSSMAANANCPVLIVPPDARFKEWSNVWHIKRKETEGKLVKYWIGKSELGDFSINVKTLQQKSYTSIIWESIVKYIKTPREELREALLIEHPEEKIDLILLVSHANDSFHKFLADKDMHIIFGFGIPVMIFQSKVK